MSFSTLNNQNIFELASEKISAAIDKMLESDPANKSYVAKLDGLRIIIDCTHPAAVFLVKFQDSHVIVSKYDHEEQDSGIDRKIDNETADLQLSGTAISLFRLATTPIDNASAIRGSNVSVSGDVGLLLELSQVTKMIDIDWELLLANKIGENPAVFISRAINIGLSEARKLNADFSEKLTEKMQTENSPLPNKNELGNLRNLLRDLNYRLDRLEAKRSNHA